MSLALNPRVVALRLLVFAVLLFGTGAAVGAALATTIGPDGAGPQRAAGADPILPAASLPAVSRPAERPRSDERLRSGDPEDPGEPATTTGPSGSSASSGGAAVAVPRSGAGTFTLSTTWGAIRGTAGRLHRYRVGVEDGTGQSVSPFADALDAVLGDPRGWTAGGDLRLQRVPAGTPADFTIVLASPVTSEELCATAGMRTNQYTSCRLPGKVVLNLARWLTAVAGYGASVEEYRQYLINHEVGHQLGHGHEACPGPGRPAPVMQQQTHGLKGCIAFGWPYRDGRRYRGPAVP